MLLMQEILKGNTRHHLQCLTNRMNKHCARMCRVYHRLESLSSDADEVRVAQELAATLGEDKMCFLQLIHQLIVCEELLKED